MYVRFLRENDNQSDNQKSEETADVMQRLASIPELDVNTGLDYCMDRDFYEEVLREYMLADKVDKIEQFFNEKDWNNYRTLVHALKSTSLTIGAVSLSDEAKALEMAAKDGDEDYIISHHRAVVEKYRSLSDKLRSILK